MKKSIAKICATMLLMLIFLCSMGINAMAAGETVSLGKALADEDNWTAKNAKVTFNDGKMTLKADGDWAGIVSCKMGAEYANKVIEFTLKLENITQEMLFSFSLRHTSPDGFVWDKDENAYLVWNRTTQAELQKYAKGTKPLIKFSDKAAMNEANKEYNVKYGAVTKDGKTTVTLAVDGKTIYEWVDEGAVLDAENSYITFYVLDGNPITIGSPAEAAPAEDNSAKQNPDTGDAGVVFYILSSVAAGTVLVARKKKA